MCGLFGFSYYGQTPIKNLSLLTNALATESAIRGTDATGIAFTKDHVIQTVKEAKAGYKMNFKHSDDTVALIGHTRHSTKGSEKKNWNNHPFGGKAKNANFALAHNGVLTNDQKLRKSLALPKTKIETDSYIANLDRKILSNMKNDKWEEFSEYQRKKLWTLIKALIEEYPDDEDSSIIHKDYTRINKYFRVNFEGRLEELLAELELKLKFPYMYKVSRYLELLHQLYGNADKWKAIEYSLKKENLRSIEGKLKEITDMHKMLFDEKPVNEKRSYE